MSSTRPIDVQDLYNQPISKLVEFIIAAYHENPDINLEVFVHKAEKLQDDDKIGASAHVIFPPFVLFNNIFTLVVQCIVVLTHPAIK